MFGVEPKDPLHDFVIGVGLELEPVAHGNALDHQRVALQLNFTNSFGLETTASGGNAPGFQGTPERAGQSAGGRSHHVVERGGMRFEAAWAGVIMLCHLGVHPERHRGCLGRQISMTQGALIAHDADPGPVDDPAHRFAAFRLILRLRTRADRAVHPMQVPAAMRA